MPSEQEIEKLIAFEKKLAEYDGEDKVISSSELKEKLEKQPERIFFKSTFPTLDGLIDGFEAGELIIISGPTKHGKTTLAKTFTENLATQGVKTLWFSYEMPPRQLIQKFQKDVIFYLPAVLKRKDLPWIETKIWEAKLKFGIQAVVIDHLHFLFDISRIRHPSLEIGFVVRMLKQLAVKHNLVIFLICHLTKIKDVPTVADIRDSSFIAQESDCVLLIRRKPKKTAERDDPEFTDEAILKIETHRRKGILGKTIPLVFINDSLFEPERSPIETSKSKESAEEFKNLF